MSAYDGVWEPIREPLDEIKDCLADEVGNPSPTYMGNIQINDLGCIITILNHGVVPCFRVIEASFRALVSVVPPSSNYSKLRNGLLLAGWDLCCGNGWVSASMDGIFPIDPITGEERNSDSKLINDNSLFANYSDCKMYADKNDEYFPQSSPWYPVAVALPLEAESLFPGRFRSFPIDG